ncbi:MAG: PSD1 and planctomycete cytochrome C domain-containing protein [Gemmataceae bacterium]
MNRALLFTFLFASSARADDAIDYNRDVRPILSDACFTCHGPDAKTRRAKLRLDLPEEATKKRGLIYAIKPGDLKESNSWDRIISDDADYVMPPKDHKKQLTDKQKEIIKKWIEGGAKYQKHWSFEPIPKRGAGSIDGFLNDAIKKAGLTAQPEADKTTLIRRLSFALTGLPPSLKELDEYLADKSPNAYEKMVDRYLASSRYGEEMARHWLDVARYADTHGLHLDNERYMWKYRDWVVKSFNENLPFDQFTKWQIAGDLLPNPTPDQLTATGFNRCNVTTGEGGSIDAEWVYRNAVDRTSAMAQAFLGLTAGCAVCHDHKFDPISMKEYYSLYAFFLSAADPALDGNVAIVGPFAKLPTAEQQKKLDDAIKAEAEAKAKLLNAARSLKYVDPADEPGESQVFAADEELFDDLFPTGSTSSNTSRNAADWVTNPSFGAKSGRRVLRQANSFFHQDAIQFKGRIITVPANGEFSAWVYLDPHKPPGAISVQFGGGKKVWWGSEPTTGTGYSGGDPGDRVGPLPKPGEWAKLSISTEKLGLKELQVIGSLTLQEHGGVVHWDAVSLRGQGRLKTDPRTSFSLWQKLEKSKPAGGEKSLREHFLAFVARPLNAEHEAAQVAYEKAQAGRAAAEDAIPGSLIFRDLGMPREAFVMARGQYDKPGDKVQPGVPAVFPPLKSAGPRPTRLDLANWLVSPEHPLTARVAVNRLWQQFFGTGLVRTSADFGTQGELPSHPELLDWLADEYRSTGWDTKKLVKRIVMSDAFRRDSKFDAKDPGNRLLARGPRLRLDAEQLRDNALFTSGLMNHTLGGRGVNPYQPPNIWEPVGYGDSNTRYYLQDHGEALYRRSLYVFIKRWPASVPRELRCPEPRTRCSPRPHQHAAQAARS